MTAQKHHEILQLATASLRRSNLQLFVFTENAPLKLLVSIFFFGKLTKTHQGKRAQPKPLSMSRPRGPSSSTSASTPLRPYCRRMVSRDELWQHRWRRCPQGVGQNCWVSWFSHGNDVLGTRFCWGKFLDMLGLIPSV